MLTGEFIERGIRFELKLLAVLVKRLHTQRSGLLDDQLHHLLEPGVDIPPAPYLRHKPHSYTGTHVIGTLWGLNSAFITLISQSSIDSKYHPE